MNEIDLQEWVEGDFILHLYVTGKYQIYGYILDVLIHTTTAYSRVPNKRDGRNKRDGGTFPSKSINVMFLIKVMVGNFGTFLYTF